MLHLQVSFSESRTSKSSGKGTRRAARQTLEGFASADSSPGPSSQRKHTPATIPRTKFSSATPLEQRLAINKLRQKLDFEEKDEVSDEVYLPAENVCYMFDMKFNCIVAKIVDKIFTGYETFYFDYIRIIEYTFL